MPANGFPQLPRAPAGFDDATRLHYTFNATSRTVTLIWNGSPDMPADNPGAGGGEDEGGGGGGGDETPDGFDLFGVI